MIGNKPKSSAQPNPPHSSMPPKRDADYRRRTISGGTKTIKLSNTFPIGVFSSFSPSARKSKSPNATPKNEVTRAKKSKILPHQVHLRVLQKVTQRMHGIITINQCLCKPSGPNREQSPISTPAIQYMWQKGSSCRSRSQAASSAHHGPCRKPRWE